MRGVEDMIDRNKYNNIWFHVIKSVYLYIFKYIYVKFIQKAL